MNKNDFKLLKQKKGRVQVYDFGKINLHAYQTDDPMNDEIFILEKNGKAVVLEAPNFVDNIKELELYIKSINITVEGLLLSYHMAGGASFLPGIKRYSTKKADNYAHIGQGKKFSESFKASFGDKVDSSINTVTDYIYPGEITIAGINMIIKKTNDAFDVEIPEINSKYIHMLGHDYHSIVASKENINDLIAQLKDCVNKKYDLILSSHHVPENVVDVKTKINYLKYIKKVTVAASTFNEFKTLVKKKYPNNKSENYLDMTANFFFPNNNGK
jgi:hypothetical protein